MFPFFKKIQSDRSEELEYNRSISQIILFAITISLVLAFLHWLARYGFEDNAIFEIIKTLSVSFCILILPNFIYRYIKAKKGNQEDAWFNSIAFISVLVLFFLVFLGLFSLLTGIKIIYLLIPISFLLLAWFLIDYFFHCYKRIDSLYIILFILFSYSIGSIVWGAHYNNPLFFEKIILGIAHPDTLNYSATSNMIKTHGIPSIGVDGLRYLHWHWGSNWIFAYLSGLINVSTIKFYNFCYPIIFIPFLFKSLLMFAVDFRKYKKFFLKLNILPYIFLLVCYLKFGFPAVGNESYLMAVSFAFILFSIIIYFLENFNKFNKKEKIYSKADNLFLFLFLPLFIFIVGLLKINIAFLLYGLYGYLFLRLKLYKDGKFIISIILCFLSSIIVYLAFCYTEVSGGLVSLPYFIEYIKSWNLFFSFSYIWMWIFVIMFFYKNKIRTLSELKAAFMQKKILEIEILLAISILGLLPGAILYIAGGSAGYFSSFPKLLSLSFVIAYLGYFTLLNKSTKESLCSRIGKFKIHFVLFALLFILNSYYAGFIFFNQGKTALANNLITRRKIIDPEKVDFQTKEFLIEAFKTKSLSEIISSIKPAAKASQTALKDLDSYELIKIFEEIGEMKLSEKRKTCVYIPKSNRIFWDMKAYKNYNHVRPLVVTAMTGIAMINGLPEGEVTDLAGYASYNKVKSRDIINEHDNNNIKSVAENNGFSQVIIIRQENGSLVIEKI